MRTASCLVNDNIDNLADNPANGHRELLALVGSHRDRNAFRSLFEYFAPRLKAMMLKAGMTVTQSDDLIQDVMMTVWQKSLQYRADRGTVSAWIFTIARNARIDLTRKASSRPYEDVYDMELAADGKDAEEAALQSEREAHIATAMDGLPDDQRKVMEMAFIVDLSQSEIARRLGLPVGTVKSRMRLAYGKLRRTLETLR